MLLCLQMKKIIFTLALACAILVPSFSWAQDNVRDSVVGITTVDLSYAFHEPDGDLADRFGNNSMLCMGVTRKNDDNWTVGGEIWFMFGGTLKPEADVLADFRTANGDVIGTTGLPSDIQMFQRGFAASLQFGKVFPLFGPNPNSGLWVKIGSGYLQHRILLDDSLEEVPLVLGDYKVGYDRLTGGIFFHQFVGYRHFSNDKRFNFYAGFDMNQGFGRSLRSWNYDERSVDTDRRYDGFYGLKFGFSLALYKQIPDEYYFN